MRYAPERSRNDKDAQALTFGPLGQAKGRARPATEGKKSCLIKTFIFLIQLCGNLAPAQRFIAINKLKSLFLLHGY